MTQKEAESYFPPPGISVIFLEWFPDKGEVIAEFVSSDLNPDPLYRKNTTDIRNELGSTFRNRVLSDNLGSHEKSPRRALVVESLLNHPFLKGEKSAKAFKVKDLIPSGKELAPRELQDAAENAIDVHEVTMSPDEAEASLKLASTGEHLKIEPDEVRQERRLVESRSVEQGGSRRYKEVYGPERHVYLSGVIDSG